MFLSVAQLAGLESSESDVQNEIGLPVDMETTSDDVDKARLLRAVTILEVKYALNL